MKGERTLGDYIEARVSEADDDRRWLALAARRRQRQATLRFVRRAAPAGAVIAIAIGAWLGMRRPITVVPEMGLVIQTRDESLTLRLADGSSVSLDRDTEITIGNTTPDQQNLDLERGTLHISVNHAAHRRFRVHAGEVDVTDIGTVFTVARDRSSSSVLVSVTEGEVDVVSAGGPPRALHAGESLTTLDKALTQATPSARVSAAMQPQAPSSPTSEPNQAPPGAVDPSPADPPSAVKAPDAPTAKSLFADAMAAREAGNAHAAAQAFDALRKRFPGDAHTPLATFELGRIRMDRLGDRAGALEALRSAIAIAPNAGFSEDAEARVIELLAGMGRASECRKMRAAFLARRTRSIHKTAIEGLCPDLPASPSAGPPR